MQKVAWNEKKLLEILDVAKKLAVNLWESNKEKGGGGGGGLLNKALFGEASPQVQSLTLIYSYFEKGCREKCTRQSWKALWVVLSSLFFEEIWKNLHERP